MTEPNIFKATCLRPTDPENPEFLAAWAERNEVILAKDAAWEAAFAAVARKDQPAYELAKQQADALQLREEALSASMRPHQFVAWERSSPNLITNVGRADMNDKYWRGAAYTQTVVMGLKGAGAAAAGDTQASHAGWLEVGLANAPTYTGNRKAFTMGAATVANPSVSVSPQQSYAITSTGTVAGMFCNNGGSATIDNTTGILVNATDFTGGNEAVNNLDTLNVTYTFNG